LITTTVIGSYPFPGWLELVSGRTREMGPDDLEEAARDATLAAVMDQVRAGLDVISDGEQGRFDFNLSFYAYLDGLELEDAPRRVWGPPAHDQRGKHRLVGELGAPRGLGAVEEFQRLRELAPPGPALKASVPGRAPRSLGGHRDADPDRGRRALAARRRRLRADHPG
jgi:5-methyltetrahydropteroyltriglutamate--homocysteine methyltransferase